MPLKPIFTLALCLVLPAIAGAQVPGSALALNGANQYACTSVPIGQPAALTVSAWVRVPPGLPAGTIIGNHYHGVSWESFELGTDGFIVNGSNTVGTRVRVNFTGIDDGQWHHVAGVWNGSQLRAYVDGSLHAGPVPATAPLWPTTAPLYIGARLSVQQPPVSSDFQGLIDELRVWTVARSQAQIHATMHGVLGPSYYTTPDSGLFAYWRFDAIEDLGFRSAGMNDARDLTSAGRHAEVVGGTLVPMSVSVPEAPLPSSLRLTVFPNPSPAQTSVRLALPHAVHVNVGIYDLNGRRVRTLADGRFSPGDHVCAFDGRDASGRSLPAGLYFVRLATTHETRSARLIVQP